MQKRPQAFSPSESKKRLTSISLSLGAGAVDTGGGLGGVAALHRRTKKKQTESDNANKRNGVRPRLGFSACFSFVHLVGSKTNAKQSCRQTHNLSAATTASAAALAASPSNTYPERRKTQGSANPRATDQEGALVEQQNPAPALEDGVGGGEPGEATADHDNLGLLGSGHGCLVGERCGGKGVGGEMSLGCLTGLCSQV